MATIQINLPDSLAREATQAGLLTPEKIEALLRQRLRSARIEGLQAARATLDSAPLPSMTAEEIQVEIAAYRAEQRRAPRP